jgi:hypothetical protein
MKTQPPRPRKASPTLGNVGSFDMDVDTSLSSRCQ